MTIRFIQTFTSTTQVYHAGNDYEVPNEDALRYINDGFARKSVEPLSSVPAEPVTPSALKPGEQVGVDPSKPAAKPLAKPKQPKPADNPAAFVHADGAVEPHTGFTTTNPDVSVSPPSDGKSPLATNTGHEAVKPVAPATTAPAAKPAK